MTMPNPQPGQMEQRMELKACPFCGGSQMVPYRVCDGYEIECRRCFATISACAPNAIEKAIAAWNTRPTPDGEIGELVVRLRRRQILHLGPPRGRVEASLLNPDGLEAADHLETQAADIARLREALGRARNGLASILPLGYPHPLIAEIDAALATRTDVR